MVMARSRSTGQVDQLAPEPPGVVVVEPSEDELAFLVLDRPNGVKKRRLRCSTAHVAPSLPLMRPHPVLIRPGRTDRI